MPRLILKYSTLQNTRHSSLLDDRSTRSSRNNNPMEAKTNLKSRLPSRHVTEGPERAPHREAIGFAPPYSAGAPTPYEFRDSFCVAAGEQVAASGGSTNAALHLPAIAHECGIAFDLFDVAEVFKRTPCIADLKPAGRFVAKDLFEADGVPLLMKALLDNGFLHSECMTVTGCSMAENLHRVAWNTDQEVVRPADRPLTATGVVVDGDMISINAESGNLEVQLNDAELEKRRAAWQPHGSAFGSGYLWKYAQQVGSARHGAVTHPGGSAEKTCYADI
jgi:dehydratase family protein